MGHKSCTKGKWPKKKYNAHIDINWAQNIGSALILCLSTISVILQPLLSKFFFLINLVSRNGSFFFSSPPYMICVSWSSCFSVEFHMIIAIVTIVYFILLFIFENFCSYCLSHVKVHQRYLSVFLQRWWNGFHQLTTCLDHNVASLWQRHLVFFLCVLILPLLRITLTLVLVFKPLPPPFNFSIVVLFPVISFWYRQFTWVPILLLWWLCAWWMLDTRIDGRWHRDFAWCPGSSMHFTCSTLRLKSLCWQVEFFVFVLLQPLCVRGPFWMPIYQWCVFVRMWSWNPCCQFNVCHVVLCSSKLLTFFFSVWHFLVAYVRQRAVCLFARENI